MAGQRMAGNDEHWQRLHRVEADLDSLKPEVASLKTDVSYIRSSMEQLLSKGSQPTPWGQIISAVGVVVVILGGYTTLITAPISAATATNATQVQALEKELDSRSYKFGTIDKQNQWHAAWLSFIEQQLDNERDRSADIEERVSRLEGREEVLRGQVDDIDKLGSRKWNSRD